MKIRNVMLASALSFGMLAGLGAPAAFAEDELVNKLKAVSDQSLVMDDQWNIAVQWADTDSSWGAITQTIDQLNAGLVIDVNAETNLDSCNCFNDVENDVDVDLYQSVDMNEQINGALQVGLTDANITQTISQLNVGAAASVSSSINIPAPDL